jgi:hypothetical protein
LPSLLTCGWIRIAAPDSIEPAKQPVRNFDEAISNRNEFEKKKKGHAAGMRQVLEIHPTPDLDV